MLFVLFFAKWIEFFLLVCDAKDKEITTCAMKFEWASCKWMTTLGGNKKV
jgi:hypothetical protein